MNLKKIIGNPIKVLGFGLPVLIIVSYVFLLVEILKGPDFWSKRIFIDGRMLMSLTLVISLFFKISRNRLLHTILKLNAIFLLPCCAVYLFFVFLEIAHYPNYVLATYQLHIDVLIFIPLFSFFLWLVSKFDDFFPKVVPLKSWRAILTFQK